MMDRVREISNYLRDNKIVTTKQGQLAIERKLQEDIKIYGADEIMAAAKVAIDKDIHSYAYLLTIIKNSKKKSDSNEKTYPTEKQKQYITNLEDSISFIINKVTHSQIVSDIKPRNIYNTYDKVNTIIDLLRNTNKFLTYLMADMSYNVNIEMHSKELQHWYIKLSNYYILPDFKSVIETIKNIGI